MDDQVAAGDDPAPQRHVVVARGVGGAFVRKHSDLIAVAAGSAAVEFVVADSEALPFPGGARLRLSSARPRSTTYPNPKRALAEMARVLERGGRLVIADGVRDIRTARIADAILRRFDRSHVRLSRSDELVALLRGAGFSDLNLSTLYGGGYAIVRGRRSTNVERARRARAADPQRAERRARELD